MVTSAGNFRLYDTTGVFYNELANTPTANRTVTIPDATFTFAGTNLAQTISAVNTFTAIPILPDGAVGTPSLRFTTDSTTGLYRAALNTIGFTTAGVEAMRIDAAGNISTTGVNATINYNADFGGSVRVAGGLVATGEVTAYFSDQRLKANITAITNAVDKVMSINGVYYNPNQLAADLAGEDITVQRVGLLAQEVEAILPHVVRAAPFDIGDNGTSKSGENYKTLQYERIVPLLVEAIKEQQSQIAALNSRIAILEKIINK